MIIFKLKTILADRNMTQKELAQITGVRLPTISDLCTGKTKQIPVTALDLICNVLECQPQDIIRYKK